MNPWILRCKTADFVFQPSGVSSSSKNVDDSVQMETEGSGAENSEHIEMTENGKRRRLSDEENQADVRSPAPPPSTRNPISSTNYRCIYLSPFDPAIDESKIIE